MSIYRNKTIIIEHFYQATTHCSSCADDGRPIRDDTHTASIRLYMMPLRPTRSIAAGAANAEHAQVLIFSWHTGIGRCWHLLEFVNITTARLPAAARRSSMPAGMIDVAAGIGFMKRAGHMPVGNRAIIAGVSARLRRHRWPIFGAVSHQG